MFSATLAVKRKLSSATKAISERSEATSTSRTSTPSTRTAPSLGVIEAGDQRHQAGLARARGPDQGHGAPGLDLEVDVVQGRDRLLASVAVERRRRA